MLTDFFRCYCNNSGLQLEPATLGCEPEFLVFWFSSVDIAMYTETHKLLIQWLR